MVAGSLTYDTKMDTSGFQKGVNQITNATQSGGTKIKNIIAALGITKLITAGINTVMGSLGDAISRLDILNNYPKVMSNLGISTDKAQQSIDKLGDKLLGLPTTLDNAALAVQRFTSANGDVEKSTNYFLALNNALLAGGASAGIQETAMEQLSQAYAKGKPDAMEWRSILTAMPGQLKQIAKQMGYTSTALGGDLYEAIQKGKVSMDDFMDAIVQLNEKGIDGFQSFEEQARNSTDGLATAIKVAKTQVVKGLTDILKATNQVLKDKGLGGISGIISNIGKKAKEFLDIIAKNLPKVINYVENAFRLFKKLLPVLSAIGAVFITYTKIIPALKGVKDAVVGLNAVINANPYVAMATALLALTGALAVFIVKANSFDGLTEKVEAQAKSWEKLKEARQSVLDSSSTEISVLQAEADELRQITDENGKVKEGYENRAEYILNDLNNALGTEYKMNNGIISQYQDLKNNIDQLIAKKKIEAALDAYKEEYGEALKKKGESVKTLTELYQKLADKQNETAKTGFQQSQKEQDIRKLTKLIKEETDLIDEYGYTIQNYENLTSASVSNNKEQIESALNQIGISYDQAKVKTNESLMEQINSQTRYNTMLNESYNNAIQGNKSYLKTIIEEQKKSSDEKLKELAKSLAKETSTVNGLTDEQVKAWKELANSSTKAYNEGLSTLDEDTRKKIEEATGVVLQEQTLPGGMKTLSKKATSEYEKTLDLGTGTKLKVIDASNEMKKSNSVRDGAVKLATDANKGFNSNVDGKAWGNDLASNISGGMTSQKARSGITGAASTIAGLIKSVIGHSVPSTGPLKDELTYMPDMINNLVKGINDNKYKVQKATESLAEDMKASLEDAVNIETGKMNATATIRSNNMFNNVIQINAKLDGKVEMDKKTTGQILAPEVTKAIKVGGLV